MNKKLLIPILALVVLLGCGIWFFLSGRDSPAETQSVGYRTDWYSASSGTFHLSDAADLAGLAVLVNEQQITFSGKTIYLDSDIAVSGDSWTPIGREGAPFLGSFDGRNYTISGLSVSDDTGAPVGLFGVVANADIKNVVVNGTIRGKGSAGGVIGACTGSTVTNCCTIGVVGGENLVGGVVGSGTDSVLTGCCSIGPVGTGATVGGVVGAMDGASSLLTSCYSMGPITGSGAVGGVVGSLNAGMLSGCHSSGSITSDSGPAGGIAGTSGGSISSCYAEGAVSGKTAGGLTGEMNSGEILCSYATGTVSGEDLAGGLVGKVISGTISESFSLGAVDAGIAGGLVGSVSGTITACYSAGTVSGTQLAGGIAGTADSVAQFDSCYYDKNEAPGIGNGDTDAEQVLALPAQQMTAAAGAQANADWTVIENQSPALVDALNPDEQRWVQASEQFDGYPFIGFSVTFEGVDEPFVLGAAMGERIRRPEDPKREGFVFTGWYLGEDLWNFDMTVTEDLVLTAQWQTDKNTLAHSITIADGIELGTVSISVDEAYKGDQIIIYTSHEPGCGLEALTAVSSKGFKQVLRAEESNVYSFVMPSEDVTISAVFVKEPLPFDDLPESGELHDAVMHLYRKGYMNGVSENSFSAQSSLTRGMLSNILYHMEDDPHVSGVGTFTDVAQGQWYYNAITWAAGLDILQGYGNGLFGPDDSVTVEQMVVIFWRYAESPAPSSEQALTGVSDWAMDAMSWAAEQGLLTQESLNAPSASATREQIAIFLYRFGILQS